MIKEKLQRLLDESTADLETMQGELNDLVIKVQQLKEKIIQGNLDAAVLRITLQDIEKEERLKVNTLKRGSLNGGIVPNNISKEKRRFYEPIFGEEYLNHAKELSRL